ncbi:hypothetical protein BD414DRAFT_497490 [Trametes punicea]|nr:hypothetical protein BD414DRAFT_497490 [Trametes punicea]
MGSRPQSQTAHGDSSWRRLALPRGWASSGSEASAEGTDGGSFASINARNSPLRCTVFCDADLFPACHPSSLSSLASLPACISEVEGLPAFGYPFSSNLLSPMSISLLLLLCVAFFSPEGEVYSFMSLSRIATALSKVMPSCHLLRLEDKDYDYRSSQTSSEFYDVLCTPLVLVQSSITMGVLGALVQRCDYA